MSSESTSIHPLKWQSLIRSARNKETFTCRLVSKHWEIEDERLIQHYEYGLESREGKSPSKTKAKTGSSEKKRNEVMVSAWYESLVIHPEPFAGTPSQENALCIISKIGPEFVGIFTVLEQ